MVLSALRSQNRHWLVVSSARKTPWGAICASFCSYLLLLHLGAYRSSFYLFSVNQLSLSTAGADPVPPAGKGEEEDGSPLMGKDAVWVLWALLPWTLHMSYSSSNLLFQMQSARGAGLHIWLS